MLKVENVEVYNLARAVYSARNAMNSWDKSDSDIKTNVLGAADLELAKKLCNAGSEHRKFMRQIFVCMDIVAPLYWWKQFDTYKTGVVVNSCSTMHKIADHKFSAKDFSYEEMDKDSIELMKQIVKTLNNARDNYLESKNKHDWQQMIVLLPESYNQRRTVTMNYENVLNMILQRSGHKLLEWAILIDEFKKLPYIAELVGI